MQKVMSYPGEMITMEKITPGNTATAINAATRLTVGNRKVPFTSGGTATPVVGNRLTGETTTTASAKIEAIVLESGTFGAGTAAGWLYLTMDSAVEFVAENLLLAGVDVCSIPIAPIVIPTGLTAIGAMIVCESNDVNFTVDGSNPTAAAGTNQGFKLGTDANIVLRDPTEVIRFKCIDRVSGSAGIVKVGCIFRRR